MGKSYKPEDLRVVITQADGTEHVCVGYSPPERVFQHEPEYVCYRENWKIAFYREINPENNS